MIMMGIHVQLLLLLPRTKHIRLSCSIASDNTDCTAQHTKNRLVHRRAENRKNNELKKNPTRREKKSFTRGLRCDSTTDQC
jgi:hypothetical protein